MPFPSPEARLERLRALDDRVVQVARPVKVLTSLKWPDDAAQRFEASVRAGRPEAPGVVLTPPGGLPTDAELADLSRQLDRADPVHSWLGRSVDDIRRSVALLQSVGTASFVERSLELYGSPNDPVHPGAPSALASAQHFLRVTRRLVPSPAEAELSDREAVAWMEAQVLESFPDDPPRVELDPDLPSLAAAGSTRIRLRQGASFSRVQLRQLLQEMLQM